MEEWVEIVPALPKQEARERLRIWREARAAEGKEIDDTRIREDAVVAEGGRTLFRYCVNCDALG